MPKEPTRIYVYAVETTKTHEEGRAFGTSTPLAVPEKTTSYHYNVKYPAAIDGVSSSSDARDSLRDLAEALSTVYLTGFSSRVAKEDPKSIDYIPPPGAANDIDRDQSLRGLNSEESNKFLKEFVQFNTKAVTQGKGAIKG